MTSSRARRYGTLLSVVLALFLTMALAACSDGGDPGEDGTPGSLLERTVERAAMPQTEAGGPEPTGEGILGLGSQSTAEPGSTATERPLLAIGRTSAATDREALVALYNATDGPNWDDNENWLSDAPLRQWNGVHADFDGRVIWLVLHDNGLDGEIPPELGNLANLELLQLSSNWWLDGGIPPELGNLSNLERLLITLNGLGGEIPPELGNLANLERLALRGNDLSGEIPPELGSLSNLERLNLWENDLSGEIPPELGSLANLEGLNLWGNQLSGCAPASWNRDGLFVSLPDTVDGYCP